MLGCNLDVGVSPKIQEHFVRFTAEGHPGKLFFQQVADGKFHHGLGVRCHARKIDALQPRARHLYDRHTIPGQARGELARMDRRNNATRRFLGSFAI